MKHFFFAHSVCLLLVCTVTCFYLTFFYSLTQTIVLKFPQSLENSAENTPRQYSPGFTSPEDQPVQDRCRFPKDQRWILSDGFVVEEHFAKSLRKFPPDSFEYRLASSYIIDSAQSQVEALFYDHWTEMSSSVFAVPKDFISDDDLTRIERLRGLNSLQKLSDYLTSNLRSFDTTSSLDDYLWDIVYTL